MSQINDSMSSAINRKLRPLGQVVNGPGGYHAFVPGPLPPPIAWDEELILGLSSADRAIGVLAGEGRRLSNPRLLIRPFARREAVLSSRIEGTHTTLSELMAAEARGSMDQSPADVREVGNYVAALEYGLERLETLPVSLRLVREIHGRLMQGALGEWAAPGEFRRSQNWIGPPGSTVDEATYVPPPPSELMGCLDAWERYLYDGALPPLAHAALVHAQFEAIHPFLDGNGRVGRLITTLLFITRGLVPSPLLYLSAYFEATRDEYYARLLSVTQRGEWEGWLLYFLKGVAIQAEDSVNRIQRMDDLIVGWKRRLVGSRSRLPERVIDLFAENPYWTIGGVAARLSVAFTTAQRAIERLEKAGIVRQVGEAKRNRLYRADAVLQALEDHTSPVHAAR